MKSSQEAEATKPARQANRSAEHPGPINPGNKEQEQNLQSGAGCRVTDESATSFERLNAESKGSSSSSRSATTVKGGGKSRQQAGSCLPGH